MGEKVTWNDNGLLEALSTGALGHMSGSPLGHLSAHLFSFSQGFAKGEQYYPLHLHNNGISLYSDQQKNSEKALTPFGIQHETSTKAQQTQGIQ